MNAWVEREAMRLLRGMNELQAKGRAGEYVAPHDAAQEIGLDPGSPHFGRLVEYLEDEGAIALDEGFGGLGLYRMTRRGLEMLAEAEERP